jgi:hypothetical protein
MAHGSDVAQEQGEQGVHLEFPGNSNMSQGHTQALRDAWCCIL